MHEITVRPKDILRILNKSKNNQNNGSQIEDYQILPQIEESLKSISTIKKIGNRKKDILLYLQNNPNSESSLDFLREISWELRMYNYATKDSVLWNLNRYLEGLHYWLLIQEYGKSHQITKLYHLQNPEAKHDLKYFLTENA